MTIMFDPNGHRESVGVRALRRLSDRGAVARERRSLGEPAFGARAQRLGRVRDKEVSEAEARLTDVRAKLKVMQDQESILDPQKTAEMTLSLVAKLKEQIANKNAALSTQRAQL